MIQFYWPTIKTDVAKYCRSCHSCQKVGKFIQKRYKTHLSTIPAFDKLFRGITVDCIDSFLKTRLNNQYLLTIRCLSKPFPEIIPLKNMKNKALMKFLIQCGLPKSVETDQELNCMSGIFQNAMTEVRIQANLCFDITTRDRTLESAIEVVLLLFVLLTFLQIKYYGPYKVKKKVN